jgi:hypothetical protein
MSVFFLGGGGSLNTLDKYLQYVIFYLQLTVYIYNVRSQFHDCRVIIVYQVTVRNKCPKYRTLSKASGGMWMVGQA